MVSKTVGKGAGRIDAVGDIAALSGLVRGVEITIVHLPGQVDGLILHGCRTSSSAEARYFFASSLVMYRRFKSIL